MTSSLTCVSGSPASSVSIAVYVNTCTGIETQLAASLIVYPNPSNDKLFVNFGQIKEIPASMKMINTLGQIVFETGNPLQINHTGIDVSHLNRGAYTLQIIFNNAVVNKAVIVN